MEQGWSQRSDKVQLDRRSPDASGSGDTPFPAVEGHFGRPAPGLMMKRRAEIRRLDWRIGRSCRDMLVRNLRRSK